MRQSGERTRYPGVHKLGSKRYRVRGKITDPRTGKKKEVDRVLKNVTLQQAAHKRAELLEELRHQVAPPRKRMRVGEYAQSWMRSKALKIDQTTAKGYATALDLHILPTLGDFYYDQLTSQDVQEWVDAQLLSLVPGTQRRYAVDSVRNWYNVLKTMTQDAIQHLELTRDATRRIAFPEVAQSQELKSLTPDELSRFLAEMHMRFWRHYALTVLLAYTGLRFCHATALRWDDWNEETGIIQVVRKQVAGRVGRLSKKKRAPAQYPIIPQIGAVLREHRTWLLDKYGPRFGDGYMFPNSVGRLRRHSSLTKAWQRCLQETGIEKPFTPHGMRYTFTDLTRLAKVDLVVRRELTSHGARMQQHYSTVNQTEMRSAVTGAHEMAPLHKFAPDIASHLSGDSGGD